MVMQYLYKAGIIIEEITKHCDITQVKDQFFLFCVFLGGRNWNNFLTSGKPLKWIEELTKSALT